jgi:hypothetical protein
MGGPPGNDVADYEVQALYHKHPHRGELEARLYRRVGLIDRELAEMKRNPLSDSQPRADGLNRERSDLIELALLLAYEEHELTTTLLCKWQKMAWDGASKRWIASGREVMVPVENTLPDDIGGYKFYVRQFTPEPL